MGYPSWGVRLPCDTPPVGLMHTLAALVYRGNHADAILNVGCIGCQRHAACATPRRWALVITMIGTAVGVPILLALTLWLLYRSKQGQSACVARAFDKAMARQAVADHARCFSRGSTTRKPLWGWHRLFYCRSAR